MRNSTLKIKKCKCSLNCEKYPTMGYAGYYFSHAPDIIKEKIETLRGKKIAEKKIRQLAYVSGSSHNTKVVDQNGDSEKFKIRSELLKIADSTFSKYIRKRDSDKNGFVKCPCCKRNFNVIDKDENNQKIVQALHFVTRKVYSRRFDENFVHAGCSKCNADMHFNPTGIAYRNYRVFLVDLFGEKMVADVENEKNQIHKLTESQIREIIKKYK